MGLGLSADLMDCDWFCRSLGCLDLLRIDSWLQSSLWPRSTSWGQGPGNGKYTDQLCNCKKTLTSSYFIWLHLTSPNNLYSLVQYWVVRVAKVCFCFCQSWVPPLWTRCVPFDHRPEMGWKDGVTRWSRCCIRCDKMWQDVARLQAGKQPAAWSTGRSHLSHHFNVKSEYRSGEFLSWAMTSGMKS